MTPKTLLATTVALLGLSAAKAQSGPKNSVPAKEVRFLEDIEVSFAAENPGTAAKAAGTPAAASAKPAPRRQADPSPAPLPAPQRMQAAATVAIEAAGSLHLKYALLLDVEVEAVPAQPLLDLMEEWWGTRYQMGGNDKTGIDCSGFTSMLYTSQHSLKLPRTAREQFQYLAPVEPAQLREGDLVFFANGGTITHVGYYLQNNKFVHASTSEGVTISDLNDRYWQARFAGAGRDDASFVPVAPLPGNRP